MIEIACGTPPAPRERTLANLKRLRASTIATTSEILGLIEDEKLEDSGCGAVDMALLALRSTDPDGVLWTIDKNLNALVTRLELTFQRVFTP